MKYDGLESRFPAQGAMRVWMRIGDVSLHFDKKDDGVPVNQLRVGDSVRILVLPHTPDADASPGSVLLHSPNFRLRFAYSGDGVWIAEAVESGESSLEVRSVSEQRQLGSMFFSVLPSVEEAVKMAQPKLELAFTRVRQWLGKEVEEFQSMELDEIALVSPDEFIEQAIEDGKELMKERLSVLREETLKNRPNFEGVLGSISPVFIPSRGAMIPYDPLLGRHLEKIYPGEELVLENNLQYPEGSNKEYAAEWSLIALVTHELFGHGFLFKHSRFFRQMGLLRSKTHSSPEARRLHSLLFWSSILLNEGFAFWLEQAVLERYEPGRGIVYKRRQLLENDGLLEALESAEYFRAFPPLASGRYIWGADLLSDLERELSSPFKIRDVVRFVLHVADVDLGISLDREGNLLIPRGLPDLVLDPGDDRFRLDQRLLRLVSKFEATRAEIDAEHRARYCHLSCSQESCPLASLIGD